MKFMQIEPPKARGVLHESMWESSEWVAEEKYDGDRRIAQFCDGGRVRFTGTRVSVGDGLFVEKTANIPHLSLPKAEVVHLDPYPTVRTHMLTGTVLDGEIVAPRGEHVAGGQSKLVTAIMGSKPEEAIRKQQIRGWLGYVVFDCLFYKGEDIRMLPYVKRRVYVIRALGEWGNPWVQPAHQFAGSRMKEAFEAIVEAGGEGVVLKYDAGLYGDQKAWVKVKGQWTADVVVMGYTSGEGKYKGQIGAVRFGQYPRRVASESITLTECGQCSGMDDALRLELTHNGKKYMGKVMEIMHNGREPTGAFRHPRFKRWRDDKRPADCIYREGET